MSEFFDQGDKERNELKIKPMAHMDRENQEELPKLQIGWIDSICLPLYEGMSRIDDIFGIMAEGVRSNKREWERLEAKRQGKMKKLETGV